MFLILTLLALGGTALALAPNAPNFTLDPDLTLALFVAPVLLDAAFDTSVRDLRRAWIPVTCLVLIAVGLTTIGVAYVARALAPGIPWAAAIALDTAKRGRIGATHHSSYDELRAYLIQQQRQSLLSMRASGEIGDDAFHEIEARLDFAELNARGVSYE